MGAICVKPESVQIQVGTLEEESQDSDSVSQDCGSTLKEVSDEEWQLNSAAAGRDTACAEPEQQEADSVQRQAVGCKSPEPATYGFVKLSHRLPPISTTSIQHLPGPSFPQPLDEKLATSSTQIEQSEVTTQLTAAAEQSTSEPTCNATPSNTSRTWALGEQAMPGKPPPQQLQQETSFLTEAQGLCGDLALDWEPSGPIGAPGSGPSSQSQVPGPDRSTPSTSNPGGPSLSPVISEGPHMPSTPAPACHPTPPSIARSCSYQRSSRNSSTSQAPGCDTPSIAPQSDRPRISPTLTVELPLSTSGAQVTQQPASRQASSSTPTTGPPCVPMRSASPVGPGNGKQPAGARRKKPSGAGRATPTQAPGAQPCRLSYSTSFKQAISGEALGFPAPCYPAPRPNKAPAAAAARAGPAGQSWEGTANSEAAHALAAAAHEPSYYSTTSELGEGMDLSELNASLPASNFGTRHGTRQVSRQSSRLADCKQPFGGVDPQVAAEAMQRLAAQHLFGEGSSSSLNYSIPHSNPRHSRTNSASGVQARGPVSASSGAAAAYAGMDLGSPMLVRGPMEGLPSHFEVDEEGHDEASQRTSRMSSTSHQTACTSRPSATVLVTQQAAQVVLQLAAEASPQHVSQRTSAAGEHLASEANKVPVEALMTVANPQVRPTRQASNQQLEGLAASITVPPQSAGHRDGKGDHLNGVVEVGQHRQVLEQQSAQSQTDGQRQEPQEEQRQTLPAQEQQNQREEEDEQQEKQQEQEEQRQQKQQEQQQQLPQQQQQQEQQQEQQQQQLNQNQQQPDQQQQQLGQQQPHQESREAQSQEEDSERVKDPQTVLHILPCRSSVPLVSLLPWQPCDYAIPEDEDVAGPEAANGSVTAILGASALGPMGPIVRTKSGNVDVRLLHARSPSGQLLSTNLRSSQRLHTHNSSNANPLEASPTKLKACMSLTEAAARRRMSLPLSKADSSTNGHNRSGVHFSCDGQSGELSGTCHMLGMSMHSSADTEDTEARFLSIQSRLAKTPSGTAKRNNRFDPYRTCSSDESDDRNVAPTAEALARFSSLLPPSRLTNGSNLPILTWGQHGVVQEEPGEAAGAGTPIHVSYSGDRPKTTLDMSMGLANPGNMASRRILLGSTAGELRHHGAKPSTSRRPSSAGHVIGVAVPANSLSGTQPVEGLIKHHNAGVLDGSLTSHAAIGALMRLSSGGAGRQRAGSIDGETQRVSRSGSGISGELPLVISEGQARNVRSSGGGSQRFSNAGKGPAGEAQSSHTSRQTSASAEPTEGKAQAGQSNDGRIPSASKPCLATSPEGTASMLPPISMYPSQQLRSRSGQMEPIDKAPAKTVVIAAPAQAEAEVGLTAPAASWLQPSASMARSAAASPEAALCTRTSAPVQLAPQASLKQSPSVPLVAPGDSSPSKLLDQERLVAAC